MIRLSSIVALFAVALLVADAYAYRTTITIVENNDDDYDWRQERCPQPEQLPSCESYLRQGRGFLQMKGVEEENQAVRERGLEECCRQLKNVEEQCRCDALHEIAREAQQQGQQGSQILQKSRMLPAMCQLRPQQCDF